MEVTPVRYFPMARTIFRYWFCSVARFMSSVSISVILPATSHGDTWRALPAPHHCDAFVPSPTLGIEIGDRTVDGGRFRILFRGRRQVIEITSPAIRRRSEEHT